MSTSRTIILCAATVAALNACASMTWQKLGASDDDFRADQQACQYEAVKNATGTGLEYGMRKGDIEFACMKLKGWSRAPKA